MQEIKRGDKALTDLAEAILEELGYDVERYGDILVIKIKEVDAS